MKIIYKKYTWTCIIILEYERHNLKITEEMKPNIELDGEKKLQL